MSERHFIVGKVAAIFFQNNSNFFKVVLVKVVETNIESLDDEMVITGSMGDLQEEEVYRFFGEIVQHPKYGKQLRVETYQKEQPTSEEGLIQFLSSDKFPGIGRKTAEKIVEAFGEQAVDKILEDPSLLETIPQLNEKKRAILLETLRLNYGMDQVIIGLNRYGFSSYFSFLIYQAYKNDALTLIEANPYRLVEEIEGIGFKKADQIAEELGVEAHAPERIRAAVLYQIFQQALQTGNTYSPAQMLLESTIDLLESSRSVEIHPEQVAEVIIALTESGAIQQEETRLYENSLYFSEVGIASQLAKQMAQKNTKKISLKKLEKKLAEIEKKLGITYGPSQKQAIFAAVTSPVFVLTGGPGTGKTTVVNGIVHLFAAINEIDLENKNNGESTFPILLAAPTGRAAKRMNETTGLPSGTIHRLLGLNSEEKPDEMVGNELTGKLLIVDEMSMVDTWLANTLLKAIPEGMQLVFVGDKDQLPSVGPGQVLHDLLETKGVLQQELTEIYRQGDGSSIISLAHEIKRGQLPENFIQNQKDRSYFACNAQQIEPLIAQIVTKAKEKGFTPQDIQVLAPMYRGPAGIDALNKMMQEIFNPKTDARQKEVKWNDTVYRIGDKVLQLQNVPEKNVFNGDMGQIVGIIYAKDSEEKMDELIIRFDLTEVSYLRSEWQQITLAYCCSIHKAQGSEFKMVILPMVHQYGRMLQRNLLYTAITRSKEILILLGEPSAYQRCVKEESHVRLTTLKERLLETMQEEKVESETVASTPIKSSQPVKETRNQASQETYLTNELIQSQTIHPMVGMGDLTPYDFLSTEVS
ncbi:MAG: ATP-dependent RecD-like DNA helicase [Enterococcus lemanii]|jgi:exodeoxyribonuclease V alpha subunit